MEEKQQVKEAQSVETTIQQGTQESQDFRDRWIELYAKYGTAGSKAIQ